jgi:hypothetical protein
MPDDISRFPSRAWSRPPVVDLTQDIADAYTREWAQILILPELPDWEARWCAPEYRIGT